MTLSRAFGVILVDLVAVTVLAMVLLPVLRRIAPDTPNDRSSHFVVTPRGGGVAVMAGAMATSAVVEWPTWALIAALMCVAGLGFLDDIRGEPASLRLALLVGLATATMWWLTSIFHRPQSPPSWLLVLAGATALVGFTNAFNFMDGINGISGLNAAVMGVNLACASWAHSQSAAAMSLALGAAGLAFLPWNLPRARMFLGDVGSYGLGFGLAVSGIVGWVLGAPLWPVVATFGVYVADTAVVVIRRAVGGRGILKPHREHVYQRLVDHGFSHGVVAIGVASASLLVVLGGWLAMKHQMWGSALAGVVLTGYLVAPRLMIRSGA